MKLFKMFKYKNLEFKNRIVRSATFEGMASPDGFPLDNYYNLYSNLAGQDIGAIITGFAYIHKNGKAIQPGQAGIDNDDKIPAFKKITDAVHENKGKIFLQIAHAGRQTVRAVTGGELWGVSEKKSLYFNEKPDVISTSEAYKLIDSFTEAALRA
ncbi:MAG: NADH:flavin oxidoreductase, partial [Calditrichia bacterium]|nr:NADH:flavin oxidoreductase [Calditrichia bacterium]